jgi:hypothetical protein
VIYKVNNKHMQSPWAEFGTVNTIVKICHSSWLLKICNKSIVGDFSA